MLRSLRPLTIPLFAVTLAVLPLASGCKVRYRRDVEPPGSPAKWQVAAGGFMRYDGYDDVAGDLEIASRDYEKPGSPLRLRLTGVIHIGDLDYYRTLQKEALDTADVVLFEGVKYEGEEKAPDLGGLYASIGQILGIGFQKDGIDYKARNFVHCDITVGPGHPLAETVDAAQLNQAARLIGPLATMKTMLAPGPQARETEDALKHQMVTVMAAQMGAGFEGESVEDAEKRLREAVGGGGNDPLAKRAEKAIEALRKVSPGMPGMGMPEAMRREILEKRNDHVIAALKERLEAAEGGAAKPQTVAVFYGAAHMPGIEQQLLEWGYRPVETTWFKAWRMNSAGKPCLSERAKEDPAAFWAPAPRPRPAAAARERQPVLY